MSVHVMCSSVNMSTIAKMKITCAQIYGKQCDLPGKRWLPNLWMWQLEYHNGCAKFQQYFSMFSRKKLPCRKMWDFGKPNHCRETFKFHSHSYIKSKASKEQIWPHWGQISRHCSCRQKAGLLVTLQQRSLEIDLVMWITMALDPQVEKIVRFDA